MLLMGMIDCLLGHIWLVGGGVKFEVLYCCILSVCATGNCIAGKDGNCLGFFQTLLSW